MAAWRKSGIEIDGSMEKKWDRNRWQHGEKVG